MAEEKTKIVKRNEGDLNPAAFMQQAISRNLTPEVMEKFMTLYDRWEAKKGKREFDAAMAGFQGECPVIIKEKGVKNKDGTRRYSYAPLDQIVKQTGKLISKHGLSYTINASVADNKVSASVVVTHEAGHSQTSSFEVPLDVDSFMNAAQKYGAALTYAKRYAFCNAFGILTGDVDTDAVRGGERESKLLTQLKGMVAKATIKELDEFGEKLDKSDKYTPEQKQEVSILIGKRRNELTKTG